MRIDVALATPTETKLVSAQKRILRVIFIVVSLFLTTEAFEALLLRLSLVHDDTTKTPTPTLVFFSDLPVFIACIRPSGTRLQSQRT